MTFKTLSFVWLYRRDTFWRGKVGIIWNTMKRTECGLFLRMHLPESLSTAVNSKWSMNIREREDPTNEIPRLIWILLLRLSFFLLPTFLYATGPLHMLFSVAHNNALFIFPPLFLSLYLYLSLTNNSNTWINRKGICCSTSPYVSSNEQYFGGIWKIGVSR